MRIPVPWVFVLTYLIGLLAEQFFPLTVNSQPLATLSIIGGVLFLLGAVIAGWGLVIFNRARTTTVPVRTSLLLVTWGPYRFSRNPMYVGLSLAYLGEAGMLHHLWPVVLLPLTIAYLNWIVIPVEEGKLEEAFGSTYEQYQRRVGRWV